MTTTNDSIEAIIAEVIRAEGGYVNDAADRGGETMYGITVAVARANGYSGPMRNLPLSLAQRIYRDRYIVVPKFDQVVAVDAAIGLEMIDTGVNMGPSRPSEMLQRWLNGFNHDGRYEKLFVDGRLGPVTLAALKAFLAWRGAEGRRVLLNALNATQAVRYLEITEANQSQRKFLFGWMSNRVAIA